MINKNSQKNLIDQDQIILAKNNKHLYTVATHLAIVQPELSRLILRKFTNEENCFDTEPKESKSKICQSCFSVFIPTVNCIVTETKRNKLKLGEHTFDWTLKNNKKVKFINYSKQRTETVIVCILFKFIF